MEAKKLHFADPRKLPLVIQISTCVFALATFGGCASGNYHRADAASDSLRKASLQINTENHAIDGTLAALDDLVNKPNHDLAPQFKAFSASLDRLTSSARRAEKAARVANEKSRAYFRDWDKETANISFDAVRAQSVSRKTLVTNEFNTVNQRYRENQAVVEPLISYLRDIRTALSTDLTPGGLESVKPLVENAEQNAKKVQTALARLTTDLAASRTQISSVILAQPQSTANMGGVGDLSETNQEQADSAPDSQ